MAKNRIQVARSLLDSLESRVLLSASPVTPFALAGTEAYIGRAALLQFHDFADPVGGKASSNSLAAPTNIVATALSATQVYITWTGSSGASGYYVYRSTNGGKYSQIAKVGGSTTSYSDASVTASTTYSYYLVALKQTTQSLSSNRVSVTTPAAAAVTVPSTPTNLAITGTSASTIALSWTDTATNETGYHVYRSTDGTTYTLVASLAAGSTAYTDSGLSSGTQFYYKVGAWNSAGEGQTAPITAATTTVVPSPNPISIFTRYGGELVLAGTSGNDSIYVSQSGTTLTIVANGATTTAAVPAMGLFIYSDGGSDTITVNSSVTVRLTIATIDGAPTTISNGDANASIWMDSTDSFSGVGSVQRVASYYEGVSKAVGINIAEPTDSGTTIAPSASLWGTGPVMGDVNQGSVGDCYFLSSLAAFANTTPAKLQNMAVDLGDGTYVVEYQRGGTDTFVRVDGNLPAGGFGGYAYAHPGASGDIWAMIMEKSYAYFRSGANTYSSLNSGWMGTVYSDFGIANTTLSLSTTDGSFYTTVSSALSSGMPVTLATFSSGTTLVSSHAYTLVSVSNVGGVNYYTVRNPWGVAGDSWENASGLATLTFAQMVANFQLGAIAT